jgi:hypothetical protein
MLIIGNDFLKLFIIIKKVEKYIFFIRWIIMRLYRTI